jgi:hypothetical protein
MYRFISRLFRPAPTTSLGRWSNADNSNIKSALANIDCCGDKLCGDPHTSKKAIDRYADVKKKTNDDDDDPNSSARLRFR